MFVDKSRTYIGIVEDNQDPKKLGRCRVRVIDIFDDIPADDIPWASPWKDLNGNGFNVPEKGKVLTVIFDSGNIYKPEYLYAEHYNINLEKKLQTLSGTNYTSMKALIFDHKTQIYVNDDEGLKLDHKFNMINITKEGIDLNLKDNFANVNIGTSTANQQAILGNHFLDWFDEFVSNLLGERSGPYLGNLGAPVVSNPEFIECLQKYRALKEPKFLSHHVNIVDNSYVTKLDRVNDSQVGDKYKSSNGQSSSPSGYSSPSEPVDYKPRDGSSTDTPAGQLSPPVGQPDVDTSEQNNDPAPTPNPDVNVLIETIQKVRARAGGQGYEILSRPYEMNIVGVRNSYEGQKYTNAFTDHMYLFYKDDNNFWQMHKYKISTMPGVYKASVVQKKDKKGNTYNALARDSKGVNVKATSVMKGRGGLGILREGFYKNVYSIGDHHGNPAMVTINPLVSKKDPGYYTKQKFYRDSSDGMTIKYEKQGEGSVGMYIHKGFPGGVSVDNWSEGCQVFAQKSSFDEFFEKCRIHEKKYGNIFNYTLLLGTDFDGVTGNNVGTGGSSNQGGGGGTTPAANIKNPTPNPEEQKSLNEYRRIVKVIQNVYRLSDNNFTSNNKPLFEDLKGWTDDVQAASDRLYELLGLKSSNQAWSNKLPLNTLIAAHKTQFLQELEKVKKSTLDKTNTYNFNLPKITGGQTEQPIPISTDF